MITTVELRAKSKFSTTQASATHHDFVAVSEKVPVVISGIGTRSIATAKGKSRM
jgi:hypothetical protein